ncbi:hypothetical protein ACYPKM_05225 [Pseudomonas aeruginosa]
MQERKKAVTPKGSTIKLLGKGVHLVNTSSYGLKAYVVRTKKGVQIGDGPSPKAAWMKAYNWALAHTSNAPRKAA